MSPRTSLIGLAGLVLGLLAALTLFASRDRPAAARPGAPDERLMDTLRELRHSQKRTADALERLEGLLAGGLTLPLPDPVARSPVGALPTPAAFAALTNGLDELRRTLARESSETQHLIRTAPIFGGESLQEVRQRRADTDWAALGELRERWHDDERAADRSQYFQTARDLLEAYGPPTDIYRPEGGMLFHYRNVPYDVPGPSWYFRIRDGIVIEFFVEDEEQQEEDS